MRPASVNCLLLVVLAATAVSLLRGTPLVADNAKNKGDIKVSVVAILASETDDKIDPRLEGVAKEIQKVHKHLKGFRLAKMTCKSVPVSGTETFELVADQKTDITVIKGADKNDRVQLKITPPTLGEITYTSTCGKFFPIVTRYQTSNNESLIIAVRVQPCNGKK